MTLWQAVEKLLGIKDAHDALESRIAELDARITALELSVGEPTMRALGDISGGGPGGEGEQPTPPPPTGP